MGWKGNNMVAIHDIAPVQWTELFGISRISEDPPHLQRLVRGIAQPFGLVTKLHHLALGAIHQPEVAELELSNLTGTDRAPLLLERPPNLALHCRRRDLRGIAVAPFIFQQLKFQFRASGAAGQKSTIPTGAVSDPIATQRIAPAP